MLCISYMIYDHICIRVCMIGESIGFIWSIHPSCTDLLVKVII